MTQKSIRFPAELADRIRAIAEAEDRTFSYVVVRAMERALGDAEGDRIPERPAPLRSTSPDPPFVPSPSETKQVVPKAQRRQKATDAMSAALARQQALNKPKGI